MNGNTSLFQPNRKERGQAVILFLLIFVTLFLFFAFVVNLGLLVHLKINLQQTADLAAYSGASWQARAMNTIGIENFRMRQDYKEFTGHVWFTFGRYVKGFDGENTDTGFNLGSSSYTPTLCLHCQGYSEFDQQTCYCANVKYNFSDIPDLQAINPSDPTIIAAQQAIDNIQQVAATTCDRVEKESMKAWRQLIAMYIDVPGATYSPGNPNGADSSPVIPQPSAGEGLLFRRQKHIENLVLRFNEAHETDLMNVGGSNLTRIVRSTIINNLNESLRDGLGECDSCGAHLAIPEEGSVIGRASGGGEVVPRFLKMNLIGYRFSTQTVGTIPTAQGGCNVYPIRFTHGNNGGDGIPIMFYKDEAVMTYFAVRLRSRPKLLYLPESWQPTLTAFSAAQPYGGRIGPDVDSNLFQNSVEYQYNRYKFAGQFLGGGSIDDETAGDETYFPLPNIAFFPGDTYGWGRASLRTGALGLATFLTPGQADAGQPENFPGYFASGAIPNNVNVDQAIPQLWQFGAFSESDPRRRVVDAYRAPNAFDALHFSIFPVPGAGSANPGFQSSSAYLQFPGGARMVQSDGSERTPVAGSSLGIGDTDIVDFYSSNAYSNDPDPPGVSIQGNRPQDRANAPWTEAAIFDPTLTSFIGAAGLPPTGRMMFSSWAPRDERPDTEIDPFASDDLQTGRTGYSVKYINFQALAGDDNQIFREPTGIGQDPSPNTNFTFQGATDPNLPSANETELGRKVPH